MRITPKVKENINKLKNTEVYWAVVVLGAICSIFCILGYIEEKDYLGILFTIIWCIAISFFPHVVCIVQAFWKKLFEKNRVKQNEYYKEIIENYSPSQLSYLDDYSIEEEKDILATILMLKLKGKIKIDKYGIRVIDSSYQGLLNSEEFVLTLIQNRRDDMNIYTVKNVEEIKREYKYYMIKDLKNSGLIEDIDKQNILNIISKNAMYISIFFALLIGGLLALYNETFGIIFGFYSLMIISYAQINSFEKEYKITEIGKIVQKQLAGLRLYLKDYSLLAERKMEEMELWDVYYIYSIILGDNEVALKELKKFVF